MKIISGSLKGTLIPTSKSNFRPSTGRLKEALFSILSSGEFANDSPIEGKEILDLFTGSGSLGFEAISRGAIHATFLDTDRENINMAKSFAKKYDIEDQTTFLNIDALSLRSNKKQYDLVFIDPPYNVGLCNKSLEHLIQNKLLKNNAIIVFEISTKEELAIPVNFNVYLERKYGNTKLIILKYCHAPLQEKPKD
ncbi:MAG UNVERIFIED_CONTAM: 16S rRNA (guanine(966)-N(2))-methyltransferase RsmD [Rickettsiaceae bacterium]|jgi:16S rRNA (guanine966-N2)-methyltransferase